MYSYSKYIQELNDFVFPQNLSTSTAYCSMEMISFEKENSCFHEEEIADPYQPPQPPLLLLLLSSSSPSPSSSSSSYYVNDVHCIGSSSSSSHTPLAVAFFTLNRNDHHHHHTPRRPPHYHPRWRRLATTLAVRVTKTNNNSLKYTMIWH